jgi:hypothetical protein
MVQAEAKGQTMPEINAATGALTIPIWGVGAVAAVFLVLSLLAVAQAGVTNVMHVMFRAGIVIAVFCAGWIYLQQTERHEHAAERRALEERSSALLARAVAPGSALSCLNELAGEAVEAACEKAVFASPEAVSAAVSYVTEELTLLREADAHPARRDSSVFAAKFAPLRAALELDRFGIVAHVLETGGCTAEKCEASDLFNDANHVLANLRDHAFDDRVTLFTAVWNASHQAVDATTAAAPPASLPPRQSAVVPSKYDFPSSDSIPPVNIMAPEGGSRSAAGAQPDPGAKPASTPVPARRPPTRPAVAASRPAAPRPIAPAAPVAVGQGPADAGSPPTTGLGPTQ